LATKLAVMALAGMMVASPTLAEKHAKQSGESEPVRHHASEPAAGTGWTEPKTGMEFVWVPSGCFQMGSQCIRPASRASGWVNTK
jgi:formylglycine-generating enzyme required for sulfatase activity